MMESASVWLCPEGDAVRWWSADHTQRLANVVVKNDVSTQLNLNEAVLLRNSQRQWSLEVALHPPLATLLTAAVNRHSALHLHLHPALPLHWQQFPFEWLRLDGAALHSRLSVNRLSTCQKLGALPIAPHRDCVVLDLLPSTERMSSPARAIPHRAAQIISGAGAVQHFLANADLTDFAALCVIAHGTERHHAPALRLPDGTPWSLPVTRGLPPLVMLLACGDDTGNLIIEAQRLLAAGAQTVLVSLGQPTFATATAFLREFFLHWRNGERLNDLLRHLTITTTGEVETQRFLLCGCGVLRIASTAQLSEQTDTTLIATVHSENAALGLAALTELVQRLTWRRFTASGSLDEAAKQLPTMLGIARHDDAARRRLCAQLEQIEPTLSALSRAWVAPLLAHLAEVYAPHLIERLKQVRNELAHLALPNSAPLLHYWSKLYYRHGQYTLALQDVAAGLSAMPPQELMDVTGRYQPHSFDLLGHLLSLLVDLNLPKPALQLSDALDDALAVNHAPFVHYQWLDRRARVALRAGQPAQALAHYHQKYYFAQQLNSNGERELAGLVYTAAWLGATGAAITVEQAYWVTLVQNYLAQINTTALGNGNENAMYLIRAAAAWGWLRHDIELLKMLQPLIPLLTAQLHRINGADSGPAGLTLAFLYLAVRDGFIALPSLPTWDEIRVGLECGRYFLELAALNGLMGMTTTRDLERFQRQRQLHSSTTFPDWFEQGLFTNWNALCDQRAELERAVFNHHHGVNSQQLVETGLLPL
ncbi:hypothetical protein CKO09_00485 [Chromatium weissei]|nr:hypothetical protein [Chromatium weissei]